MEKANKQKPYGYDYIHNNLKTLKEQELLRLCMPGHKGRLPKYLSDAAYDVTETYETDDLHCPSKEIKLSQQRAAEVFGAGYTFFITGGATGAIHIMLMSAGPGKLILAGDFHKSAIYGMGLAGIQPVFCEPCADAIAKALDKDPELMGALITSPSYRGRCLDTQKIGLAIKKRNKLLLIDEAHGGHFYFGSFPSNASDSGADMWVNSLHKTLPCLTQAAILNMGAHSKITYCSARSAMAALHTSSPSYPIMASIEYGVNKLKEASAFGWINRCTRAMDCIDDIPGLRCQRGADCDPVRIVIDTTGRGWRGYEALVSLKNHGILCEMADENSITLLTADMDFERRLIEALKKLTQKPPLEPNKIQAITAEARRRREYPASIREAMLGGKELVEVSHSEGRISACCAGAYPPGAPYIIPGQKIDKWAAELLSQKRPMFGIEEGRLAVINEG